MEGEGEEEREGQSLSRIEEALEFVRTELELWQDTDDSLSWLEGFVFSNDIEPPMSMCTGAVDVGDDEASDNGIAIATRIFASALDEALGEDEGSK